MRRKPSTLPVFLVRDTSVVRIKLSNLWLHHSFTEAIESDLAESLRLGLDWFIVIQIEYVG